MRPRLTAIFAIQVALLSAYASAAGTQVTESRRARGPLWGELRPGSFPVGFRVSYRLDKSRAWDSAPDSLRRGEFTRPIRISVWYPARPARGARVMRHRQYFHHRAPNPYFARLDSIIEIADVDPARRFTFGGSDSLFQAFLALETAAFHNAPVAPGSFPLIAYSEGYNDRSQDNTVLAEYLASHGYVVATVPQVGTRSTRLTLRIHPVDLETQARDVEFAIGVMQDFPSVNRDKLGLLGYSMGGVIALWIAGRNPNVDAVVGLDPSFRAPRFVQLTRDSPYFDPRRLRLPLLALQSGNPSETSAQDSTVVDSLIFADRYVARIGNAMHGDFSDFAMVASVFPVDIIGRTAQEARNAYQAVCRYVLAFLDGSLKGDTAALTFVGWPSAANAMPVDLVRMTVRTGVRVPTEENFMTIIERHGYEAAVAEYRNAVARYPKVEIIQQASLNRLGYGLLERRKASLAVQVFRLNVEAHSSSADAYDSLADGLIAAGDRGAPGVPTSRFLLCFRATPHSMRPGRTSFGRAPRRSSRDCRARPDAPTSPRHGDRWARRGALRQGIVPSRAAHSEPCHRHAIDVTLLSIADPNDGSVIVWPIETPAYRG